MTLVKITMRPDETGAFRVYIDIGDGEGNPKEVSCPLAPIEECIFELKHHYVSGSVFFIAED